MTALRRSRSVLTEAQERRAFCNQVATHQHLTAEGSVWCRLSKPDQDDPAAPATDLLMIKAVANARCAWLSR